MFAATSANPIRKLLMKILPWK